MLHWMTCKPTPTPSGPPEHSEGTQLDVAPATAVRRACDWDTKGPWGAKVLRYLAKEPNDRVLLNDVPWGYRRSHRAIRADVIQLVGRQRRLTNKTMAAAVAEDWPRAISHLMVLRQAEAELAVAVIAWLMKLMGPPSEWFPDYMDRLTTEEGVAVALGYMRPYVGEKWPKTYDEWVAMNKGIR